MCFAFPFCVSGLTYLGLFFVLDIFIFPLHFYVLQFLCRLLYFIGLTFMNLPSLAFYGI